MPHRLALLFVLLLFSGLLLTAGAAHGAPTEPEAEPLALEEPFEDEEGEEESEDQSAEEECEEAGEELAEGEISQEELEEACERERQRSKPGPGGVLPEECLVRTFRSSAVVSAPRNRLKLTIQYTTFESTAATIDYTLKGSHLGTAKRHLGDNGAIHLGKHLSDSQMKKLKGAHKLSVRVDISSTPASCKRYYSDSAKVQHR